MNRAVPRWVLGCAIAAYVFLYLPLIVVVVFSFNDSKLNAEWVGFTTAWYAKLFHNEGMLVAARNSLLIALVASIVSTVLGTIAGFTPYRFTVMRNNGVVQTVDLKNGSIIRPTGATPSPGEHVALIGYYSNGTFIANRVVLRP